MKSFRPDFRSKLVHRLAIGIPKFYIAPYDKIKHGLVNLSYNCDLESGLRHMEILLAVLLHLFFFQCKTVSCLTVSSTG